MKKSLLIVAVLVSLLTVVQPVLASLPTSNVPPVTVYTNLSSSNVVPLLSQSGVTNIGAVDPTQQLSITVSLKLRNKDALKQKIETAHANHKSGRIVSDADMAANYSPDSTTHSKLLNFLTSCGLTVTKTYSNHMAIQVSGSASAVEKAFNVSLNNYTDNGTLFYANSTEPQLPSDIASSVESIDGLNSIQLKPSSTSTSFPASPQEMQKAYDATPLYANNINGKGINIAVASYYSFKQSDITTYLNYFNITGTNPVNIVNIDGTPTYNNHAGSDETTLDLESVLSSAPSAQITLYDGVNTSSSTETDTFTRIVDDGTADVVTYSWGENESDFSPSQINALDSLFVAGSAKGMTFLVSSGDNGSGEIDYPATDPYITCVGGTTLALNNATGLISSETGWSGSGGGASTYFPKPAWQSGLEGSTTTLRTIPDVASDADPNSGYMIYSNGRWGEIGGTSVASPEWAGIIAMADQERTANGLGTLGSVNSELYALANSGVYHDITSGSNGSYSCETGYDMVTGLGSPDVSKLVNALASNSATIGTPSNLTATPISATQINLIWSTVNSATSYKVYRAASTSGLYAQIGNSTSTSFSDIGLTQNSTYYYEVSAVGPSGSGQQSNPVSAVTLQATLQSIAITTPATKLSYNIGDSLDITGLVVTGTYSDGSTQPQSITAANVTGFNSSVAATNQVLTITVNGMIVTYNVQIVAAPNTSGIGDFYDTTTMIHYSMSGITGATKSLLVAAFANGDHFLKKEANGKFLDYNGAYAEFQQLMIAGSSANDAIAAIAADTTLQKTIDTSNFTEASSTVVNPFLVAPKFNIFEIDGTLDLTKATVVKATGTEGTVSGIVNTTTGAFTIDTSKFATESVTIQAYDAQGNTVGNLVSVVVM